MGEGGSILGQIYVTSFMSSPLPLQLAISLSSLSRWVTTSARTRFRWIGPPVRIWLIFDKNSSPRSKSRRTWQDGSKSRTSLSDFAGKSYRCIFFVKLYFYLWNTGLATGLGTPTPPLKSIWRFFAKLVLLGKHNIEWFNVLVLI